MSKQRASAVEGRANTARPSLRLLPLLFTVAALLTAPPAQAAPLAGPVLRGTDPPSPGASLEPRLQGETQGEVVKAVIHARTESISGGGPFTAAGATEDDPIVVYAEDPTCEVPAKIVAESRLGVLEGEGIPVTVGEDSTTTFYATESNEEGPSECSLGLTYRQVTTPPAAPTFSGVSPASSADDNFPHLTGSADPEATVSIYTNSTCEPPALASGTGAAFAAPGIQVTVPDNSESNFYARASLAGYLSGCSASPIFYKEVTPPPTEGGSSGSGTPPSPPHLRMLPGGRANDNTPQVTGSAPGAGTVKVFGNSGCGGAPVVTGSESDFASGLTVQVADNTVNTFTAVSVAGGSASVCSAPVTYVEDSSPPHTRITMGPGVKTRHRKAVFRFTDTTDDPPGTTFLCKVDRSRWKQCSSPFKLRHLRFRRHVLRVRAIDVAGNAEAKGVKRRFKVIHGL
jgi:hypothetical protein